MNCKKVFNHLVDETEKYLKENGLKCMVLGISGGIDSTVVAAICHEVSKRTGIKFIGRSLPIKNKHDEFTVSELVGEAFCSDFRVVNLNNVYDEMLTTVLYEADIEYDKNGNIKPESTVIQTPIANGNIQARLRMIYLYNLAGINKGLVMDTDNLSEHYLGFYTIHGDQGDFNPIGGLWKTEVYELAKWLVEYYEQSDSKTEQSIAIQKSIDLVPTDGLGISSSDLEQIGAKSYNDVDDILQTWIYKTKDNIDDIRKKKEELVIKYGEDVVDKVTDRYLKSSFKRKKLPIVINTSIRDLETIESQFIF